MEKELARKRGKLYAFFVDLKAAFDRVDRRKLWEAMCRRGISERLTERVREIYVETKNIVQAIGKRSGEFYTEKGVRQGCPLRPALFVIMIDDLEEELQKRQAGGVVVGKEKFWSLAYADDLVLLAKEENEMKEMMVSLRRYLERKGLTLNVKKSKIMKFKKEGGRERKVK